MKPLYSMLFLLIGCQSNNYQQPKNVNIDEADNSNLVDASIDVITETNLTISKSKHQNILIIGDSEAMFAGFKVKNIQQPNETVYVDGKPSTTIGQWNNGMFRKEMDKYFDLDVVVIFLGTNNVELHEMPPYQNILNEVKVRQLKCVWVGPPKVYNRHHQMNDLIKEAVSDTCIFIDTEALGIELVDNVHPTPTGTIKWLNEIWRVKDGR